MDKAESILYSDYNIIVLKIDYDDLKSENFENMQELGGVKPNIIEYVFTNKGAYHWAK